MKNQTRQKNTFARQSENKLTVYQQVIMKKVSYFLNFRPHLTWFIFTKYIIHKSSFGYEETCHTKNWKLWQIV